MSTSNEAIGATGPCAAGREQLDREFGHLRSSWCWFFSFGILLVACGTAAAVVPPFTLGTSLVAMIVLGVSLMIGGVATIATSLWAGKSSSLMLNLLIGILYLVAGYVITDTPLRSAVMMAAFIAALFVVGGLFRIVIAVVVRFPHWGWALLNGLVTFLCGVIIYRHFAESALWVVGLLVGLEMVFHGWNWIVLSLAIRSLPKEA